MNLCIAHGGDVSEPSGGTDRVTAIASGLQERGFDVGLVVPEPEAELPARLDEVDVHPVPYRSTVLPGGLLRAFAVSREARDLARQRDAILQLEHSTLAGVATLRGADRFVLDMHDLAFARFDHVGLPLAPLLGRGVAWLERRAATRADHVVTVSEHLRAFLGERWGVPESQTSVVPNGFYPGRIAEARETPVVDGRVCFLGTLHPKVDVAAFEAVAALPAVEELLVVGDGARRADVEALARRHDAVRCLGRLPDREAFECLASAAVAVNPQTRSVLQRSSSPVKLYYYAALGRPMVVTPGPSVVEELIDAGAAIAATSPQGFAEQVERVLSADALATELGENALQLARGFNWDERVNRLANIYHERLETGVVT